MEALRLVWRWFPLPSDCTRNGTKLHSDICPSTRRCKSQSEVSHQTAPLLGPKVCMLLLLCSRRPFQTLLVAYRIAIDA